MTRARVGNPMLDQLLPRHPRLMLTEGRLVELQALATTDALAAKMRRDVLARADELAAEPTPTGLPPGAGGLQNAGRFIEVAHTCGLAWKLTGDARHLETVRRFIGAACAAGMGPREDSLGNAEIAFAVAHAYDWCRDALPAPEREAMHRHLLAIVTWGATCYDEGDWWVDTWININHETNAAIITAALAIGDTDRAAAERVLPRALHWLRFAFGGFEPDGGWPEGAGYWPRTVIFCTWGLAALRTALGTDYGLGAMHGYAETPRFLIASTAPHGAYAAFADCPERRSRMPLPILQWIATRADRPLYARYELAPIAAGARASALHLLWYDPSAGAPIMPDLALDQRFRGAVDFVSMRGSWHDPRAIHAWTKGGWNQVNHGHLDLGAFEFDALGKRWARDLGVDSYALPGYFDAVPGGKRWTYFRLGSLSHNVPTLDGANQAQSASAKIVTFVPDAGDPRAVVEFSEAYQPTAHLARRGYRMPRRRALLVQDEFLLTKPARFRWNLTTDAAVEVRGATATLTLDGETVTARILEPAGAVFSVASARREPPERTNDGVAQLQVVIDAATGPLRVAVLLSPRWPDGDVVEDVRIEPLGRWPAFP